MVEIQTLAHQTVPITRACAAFNLPRSSYYQQQAPAKKATRLAGPTPPRALASSERATVRAILNSQRFVDQAPRQVYATLLDEGSYHCSVRTMYRILHEQQQVQERRNQRRHPAYSRPELLASAPNQLWSWDITKFRTPTKLVYFYLYVILDVFSRYVVGWMLAEQESADLAQQLISQSWQQQAVDQAQLTLHADRGAPMTALTTAQLLDKLGIQKSHSRPYTPNDNPYSEAQFKTLKYRPDFPAYFNSLEEARQWARGFFQWYNHDHHHSGLALLTPATVHHGQTEQVVQQRTAVLQLAYQRHPERFVHGLPQHPTPSTEVWINAPLLVRESVPQQ